MNKEKLKTKIDEKTQKELIDIILSVHSSLGEVLPYYDNRERFLPTANHSGHHPNHPTTFHPHQSPAWTRH